VSGSAIEARGAAVSVNCIVEFERQQRKRWIGLAIVISVTVALAIAGWVIHNIWLQTVPVAVTFLAPFVRGIICNRCPNCRRFLTELVHGGKVGWIPGYPVVCRGCGARLQRGMDNK
jgi:hypothetical protein